MTDDTLAAAVERLTECGCLSCQRILAALESAQADARRWDALRRLWAASTELSLRQDEDGRWSIHQIEPADDVAFAPLVGDTPDAAIEAAMEGKP